jgi:hypothetical protein
MWIVSRVVVFSAVAGRLAARRVTAVMDPGRRSPVDPAISYTLLYPEACDIAGLAIIICNHLQELLPLPFMEVGVQN